MGLKELSWSYVFEGFEACQCTIQVLVHAHFTCKKHTQDASEVCCNLTLWGGSAPPTPRWGSAPDPEFVRRIVSAYCKIKLLNILYHSYVFSAGIHKTQKIHYFLHKNAIFSVKNERKYKNFQCFGKYF